MIPRQRRSRRPLRFDATTAIAVVLLLLFVFLGAGYFQLLPVDEAPAVRQSARSELAENEARWRTQRPDGVAYTVVRRCDCERAWREPYLAREDGSGRSARFRDPLVGADGATTSPPDPLWIDELFATVREAQAAGLRVDVEYDSRYGYPARVRIQTDDAGSDRAFDVRDFRVLPGSDR